MAVPGKPELSLLPGFVMLRHFSRLATEWRPVLRKKCQYCRASKASLRALIGNFPTSVGVRNIETWKREDRHRNMDELLGKRAENQGPAYEVKTEGLPLPSQRVAQAPSVPVILAWR